MNTVEMYQERKLREFKDATTDYLIALVRSGKVNEYELLMLASVLADRGKITGCAVRCIRELYGEPQTLPSIKMSVARHSFKIGPSVSIALNLVIQSNKYARQQFAYAKEMEIYKVNRPKNELSSRISLLIQLLEPQMHDGFFMVARKEIFTGAEFFQVSVYEHAVYKHSVHELNFAEDQCPGMFVLPS